MDGMESSAAHFLLQFLQPDREDELARIEGCGGKVVNWGGPRVQAILAMSRAVGLYFHLFLRYHALFFYKTPIVPQ